MVLARAKARVPLSYTRDDRSYVGVNDMNSPLVSTPVLQVY